VIGDAPTGTSSGATGTASFAAFNRNIGSGVETFSGYKKVPQQKKHVLGHAIPGRGAQKRRVRSKLVQSCRHPKQSTTISTPLAPWKPQRRVLVTRKYFILIGLWWALQDSNLRLPPCEGAVPGAFY
jgi:hypothetical protein